MRERSANIGGRLDVRSETNVGTEIELRIAAAMAYAKFPMMPRSWIRRLFAHSGRHRATQEPAR
jgi:hypothetical protein